jgi:hypothetical protein
MGTTKYFTENIVLLRLEQECKETGLRRFCRIHGLDPGHVSRIINNKMPLVKNAAKAVGYKPVKMYEQI